MKKRSLGGWLIAGLLLAAAAYAIAEELTLVTYYPSPRGVYNELRTMGETRLAQQGGSVGIGIEAPTALLATLDVAGTVRIVDGTQEAGKVLTSSANGVASWQAPSSVPARAVMFFNLSTCPSGWTELAAAQGRYIVGLPAGGTLAETDGTALTDLEDRPAGMHTHSASDAGHSHAMNDVDATGGTSCGQYCQPTPNTQMWGSINTSTQSGSASITVASGGNPGDVGGTNAPYLQLLACQKD